MVYPRDDPKLSWRVDMMVLEMVDSMEMTWGPSKDLQKGGLREHLMVDLTDAWMVDQTGDPKVPWRVDMMVLEMDGQMGILKAFSKDTLKVELKVHQLEPLKVDLMADLKVYPKAD